MKALAIGGHRQSPIKTVTILPTKVGAKHGNKRTSFISYQNQQAATVLPRYHDGEYQSQHMCAVPWYYKLHLHTISRITMARFFGHGKLQYQSSSAPQWSLPSPLSYSTTAPHSSEACPVNICSSLHAAVTSSPPPPIPSHSLWLAAKHWSRD